MEDELTFESKLRTFSESLRDRLLTDKYGRWGDLDPDLLLRLCDRIEDEVAFHFDKLLDTKPEVETQLIIKTDYFPSVRP